MNLEKTSVSRRSPTYLGNTLLTFHSVEFSFVKHCCMVLYILEGTPSRKEVISIPDCLNAFTDSLS